MLTLVFDPSQLHLTFDQMWSQLNCKSLCGVLPDLVRHTVTYHEVPGRGLDYVTTSSLHQMSVCSPITERASQRAFSGVCELSPAGAEPRWAGWGWAGSRGTGRGGSPRPGGPCGWAEEPGGFSRTLVSSRPPWWTCLLFVPFSLAD